MTAFDDTEADELKRLRRDAKALNAENERLRAQARDDDERIHDLEADAFGRDAAMAAVRSQLDAANLELSDLRAVRDALTPPTLPQRPGLEFEVSYLPARQRVSGDFYLAAEGPHDATVIVVGDVSGKGAEAAQRAAFARTVFATTAAFSDEPCQLLHWANAALTEHAGPSVTMLTVACLTYVPGTRRLRWALAGHPPPLRLGSGDELSGGQLGPPLGILEDFACGEAEMQLESGDGLLLYTDGLTEARQDDELFGVDRAAAVLREMAGDSPAALVARLCDDASRFSGGELPDDLCLVTVTAT